MQVFLVIAWCWWPVISPFENPNVSLSLGFFHSLEDAEELQQHFSKNVCKFSQGPGNSFNQLTIPLVSKYFSRFSWEQDAVLGAGDSGWLQVANIS